MVLSDIPIHIRNMGFGPFSEIPTICIRAKCCPDFEMVVHLMVIFGRCRHTIIATDGFKIIENMARLKPGKHYLINKKQFRQIVN